MKVSELIEKLSKFSGDLEVCCAANGYDSTESPIVEEVKIEKMILLSGIYYPAHHFPPDNIGNHQKHVVVLIG